MILVSQSFIKTTYLAHRIVVMTGRLGKIKGVTKVDPPRPKGFTKEQYLKIRNEVFGLLEE